MADEEGVSCAPHVRTPPKPNMRASFRLSPAQVKFYDLGGGRNIRSIWDKYYHDAHGLLYVVDGADGARWGESKDSFVAATSHKYLKEKVRPKRQRKRNTNSFEAYTTLTFQITCITCIFFRVIVCTIVHYTQV